jgi:hypothetical protein
MKYLALFVGLSVAPLLAIPVEYNNSAWYTGLDPHLVGKRENFLIQGVSLDAVQNASGFTGEFIAVLKFNYGGPSPEIGSLSTLSPFDVTTDGIVSTLEAADLFFRQSGVIRYGIPLVDHGGTGSLNGRALGEGVFDQGDLYHIANGVQTVTSNQFLSPGINTSLYGAGRTVWMTSGSPNPAALQAGSTQIAFHGECTDLFCPQAEYTVTINMSAAAVAGSDWYSFLVGISDGTIAPYFTGAACGNDLIESSVPEPSTWALLVAGLVVFAARRRN